MEKMKRNTEMARLKDRHELLTFRGERSALSPDKESYYKDLYKVEDSYHALHIESLTESITEMQSILNDIKTRHSQRLERRTTQGYKNKDKKITEALY